SIVVTEAGSGYSSTPMVTVEGMDKIKLKVTLKFSKDLKKNGAIDSIEIAPSEGVKKGDYFPMSCSTHRHGLVTVARETQRRLRGLYVQEYSLLEVQQEISATSS